VETVSPIDSATAAGLGLWLAEGGAGRGTALLRYGEEGVSVILEGGCRVILGNTGLDERWASFTELCRMAPETSAWSEVDMRYGGQAVLRMEGG